ncbi:MAG: CarD family transcriptional regulator [Acidobacteriota bacterium]
MFKVNDYVVYGSTGVCLITDIQQDEFAGNEGIEYYVLKPVYSENMTIKIPVNNVKVKMRKTMSKDEVLALIAKMPEQETLWLDDNRERSEYFKAALKTGKSEEWVKIIKTIYLEKTEKAAIGKKLSKTDEDVLKSAEKQLNEEFALALGISPDEVLPYILQHIPPDA